MLRKLTRYKATIAYMAITIILNKMFVALPLFYIAGEMISPLDFVVGIIFVFRDFAQREIGHRVIIPMILAGLLSYLVADATVAFASTAAFFVSELIDWVIFTYTRKPLSQRLFLSAAFSSPADSFLFLYFLGQFNWLAFSIMTATKIFGVALIMIWWRRKQQPILAIAELAQ